MKNEDRDSKSEAITVVPARDDIGCDYNARGGDVGRWIDWGYIVLIKLTGLFI